MVPVNRQLGVVALLKPLGAGLHDPALGIGEVALRLLFRFPVIPLVGLPPFRVAILSRFPPPLIVNRPLRRLQPLLGRLYRRQPILPPTQLLQQLVPSPVFPVALVFLPILLLRLLQQLIALLSQRFTLIRL